jgi:hypothetical protein
VERERRRSARIRRAARRLRPLSLILRAFADHFVQQIIDIEARIQVTMGADEKHPRDITFGECDHNAFIGVQVSHA